nr:hypothetical protein [Tanacetum cinerariifolium]GFA68516.1 hypothetical protein [Tanacetum cinerariifolium]GFA81149.1 hypothetical protein [Tanacetum cinerariifolium]
MSFVVANDHARGVHEMVVEECHEPNSEGSGSAWMTYINARIAGLFLLVLLEYPNDKGVVCATSRGLDMALHWSGVWVPPLMSPRQDETSEPLLYAGWMVDPYRCKDATRGVLHGSHDNTDDDTPLAKDGEVTAVDATQNPIRIWKNKTKRAVKRKKDQRMHYKSR